MNSVRAMPPSSSRRYRSERRRLRHTRYKMPRRHWRNGFSGMIPFLLGFASITTLSSMTPIGQSLAATAMNTLRDLEDVLASRSPGARPSGALMSSKGQRARAFPLVGPSAPAPGHSDAAEPLPLAMLDDPAAYYAVPGIDWGAPPNPGSISSPWMPSGLPVIVPGPGIHPVSPSGPGVPIAPPWATPTPPLVPVPVPEPQSWLMLVTGFCLIGAFMRQASRSEPRL